METIEYRIGTCTIILDGEKLVIIIPREHWSKRQWKWLVDIMAQLIVTGMTWVVAPATIDQLSDLVGCRHRKVLRGR